MELNCNKRLKTKILNQIDLETLLKCGFFNVLPLLNIDQAIAKNTFSNVNYIYIYLIISIF